MGKEGEPEQKDVLEQCMGSMGRYQWFITLIIFLCKFPIAWHLISHGIMVPKSAPIYCVNTTQNIEGRLSKTEMKALLKEACSAECPQLIVSDIFYDNTIVSQFHLACQTFDLTTFTQSMVMVGVFVGNFVFGILADKYGRKFPFLIACLSQPFCGIGAAFSPNIYVYCFFKFLLNVFVGGTMISSFVLFSELVGKKYRPAMGILFHVPFAMGHMSLVLFALFLKDWRWFQLGISCPATIFIMYYWLVPESPRWLLTVGRTEEAIGILELVARRNTYPTENIRSMIEVYQAKKATEEKPKKGQVSDLFKNFMMASITLLMWVNWFAVASCFYGIAQYTGSMSTNLYVNFTLTGLVQIPGALLLFFTLDFIGRKWTMIFANLLAASSFIVLSFCSTTYVIIPATIAMFGLTMSFVGAYVYSGELFPTVIRNTGIGSSSSMGRAGGIIAAFIADIKIIDWLPPVMFAVIIGLAGLGSFFLPETKGTELPDTIEDIKQLKERKK